MKPNLRLPEPKIGTLRLL